MKDGGSYLQSDRRPKHQLAAMPQREVAARRDDCDLSTGLLFSRKLSPDHGSSNMTWVAASNCSSPGLKILSETGQKSTY